MGRLMDQAREMVNLSKSITERIKVKGGEINEDEVLYLSKSIIPYI